MRTDKAKQAKMKFTPDFEYEFVEEHNILVMKEPLNGSVRLRDGMELAIMKVMGDTKKDPSQYRVVYQDLNGKYTGVKILIRDKYSPVAYDQVVIAGQEFNLYMAVHYYRIEVKSFDKLIEYFAKKKYPLHDVR